MPACPPAFFRPRQRASLPGPIEVPQPSPDVIPLPPTPHPEPSPDLPPGISDPMPPGVGEPVREPGPPSPPSTRMQTRRRGRRLS